MNFFARMGKKSDMQMCRTILPGTDVLRRTLTYTEHLVLPESSGNVIVRIAGEQGTQNTDGERPGCLLFYTDGTEASGLNAGYMAGQSMSFLRFLGVDSTVLRGLPEGIEDACPENMRLIAALTPDERYCREKRTRRNLAAESPCICTENRENWSDELLTFARACYPRTFRRIRASRNERWIHFAMKRTAGHHAADASFEAGMAAANIMSAAEELWVDLEMVKVRSAAPEGYLFSVCRKGDRYAAAGRTAGKEEKQTGQGKDLAAV